jgi:fructokinase
VGGRHVSTDFLQTIAERETGQVQVTFTAAGDPAYHIAENAAWDFIQPTAPARQLAAECRAIYFGSLCQRGPQSRAAIRDIVARAKGIRVLDVNLRRPHVDAAIIDASLSLANVAKLNEEELLTIARMLSARLGGPRPVDECAARLLQAYELRLIALTRGPRGTVFYTLDGRIEGRPSTMPRPAEDADSVGAGDACCAGLVYGLLMNWPLPRTLELANRLGAYVSTQPGGTPELPEEVTAATSLTD